MKILLFSDIHSDLAALRRLMAIDADAYFCAGDLVNMGESMAAAAEILRPKATRTFVIPGNHESAAQIAGFCAEFGMTDLHGRSVDLGGVQLAALGYSNITPFSTLGEYSEAEIAQRLAPFAALNRWCWFAIVRRRTRRLTARGRVSTLGRRPFASFLIKCNPRAFTVATSMKRPVWRRRWAQRRA